MTCVTVVGGSAVHDESVQEGDAMVTAPNQVEAYDATDCRPASRSITSAHAESKSPHRYFVTRAFILFLSIASLLQRLDAFCQAASPPAKGDGGLTDSASATLVYHRFGPVAPDSMTVRTSVFAHQMRFLRENGYTVVPLPDIVNFVIGRGQLPTRAVAITVDDGHRTVFTEMRSIVQSIAFR